MRMQNNRVAVVLAVVVAAISAPWQCTATSVAELCTPRRFFAYAAHGDTNSLDTCINYDSSLVDQQDAVGCSPLIAAAFNGHEHAALTLYRRGSPVDARCNNNYNAVAYARLNSHDAIAAALIRFGAADMRIPEHLAPCSPEEWSVAVRSGNMNKAEECVLAGFDVNRPLDAGCPAIVSAAINGNADAVQYLAARGAHADGACSDGSTPLMHAARRGDVAMVKVLTAVGADIEAETPANKWTALTFATTNGQIEVAKYLHRLDMDFEEREWTGTPLMWAAAMGQEDMLQHLLKSNRKSWKALETRDEHGQTAVMWAAQTGHLGCLMQLVQAGATLQVTTHAGWTPLMAAAYEGHHGIVEYLLRNGADKDARDKGGWTAIMWAIVGNKREIMQQLLDSGASVAPTVHGWSPILVAAATGNEQLFTLMIQNGQDLMSHLDNGATGEDIARQHGHHRLAEHLRHMFNARRRYTEGGNEGHDEL
ncbi:hypothetical protein PTSG_13132 [Salpingoeca rosetta]|uniref:Uncharacterized protein n=1 Tax=Salpingoeca rosetta (strain ATCC 50818 / BSB-021) TaxID=946362 RepID=F2USF5_SALR5|nr:uncharacterized protein PTSG_13132 [Salpingoeca rosetta]EGD81064.1 hypothetical protein PTSG_13132 [Salpingoeca rosetta]|eukprot:XP_004987933.1 hypothetical protein PTSG_13132 [Salpingoeca rosetta]